MPITLNSPIEHHPGLTSAKAESLKKDLNIFTIHDLIGHYPFRYVDRTKIYKTTELSDDMPYVQLKGKIHSIKTVGIGHKSRLTAILEDNAGEVELVWFQGAQWVQKSLKENEVYIVFGKPQKFNHKFNIAHPELKLFTEELMAQQSGFEPIYSTSENLKKKYLDTKGIQKLIVQALKSLPPAEFEEYLPKSMIQSHGFVTRNQAILHIHQPPSIEDMNRATKRLKFDELFFIQLNLIKLKIHRNQAFKGFVLEKVDGIFDEFYKNNLPYELTNAQKRVLKEIRRDTLSGKQMNRLLQGDVGSGKTIVGLMTMLMAINNGFQATILAPTEILAQQHYVGITELIGALPVKVRLLTGSVKAKERRELLPLLESGEIDILIGTHAIIEDTVVFKNLGMAIIDEQHKFGVAQRAKLWRKNNTPPHILVMTATPIPRTLAMTLYGDLDYSIIDELPPGRQTIKTIHKFDSQRLAVFGFMREEIAKGRQIYIVYPLIDESEMLDHKAVTEGYDSIIRDFPEPIYHVAMLHGKLKSKDKEYEMQRFIKGEANILVATTVIEVGVNVPNASVMIIESAERFGLSQLHQLRGRVGR
nr:ATP-dependent DNA helicase RecG [Chitinophagales bacterium]